MCIKAILDTFTTYVITASYVFVDSLIGAVLKMLVIVFEDGKDFGTIKNRIFFLACEGVGGGLLPIQ